MVIKTESPRIDAARKMVLELLLGSGNHNCLVCEANGECELQALAYRYQVPTPSFANSPDTQYYYEDDNSMIVRDFSKCIMCGRCVRGCNERQVNQAISIGYRGSAQQDCGQGGLSLYRLGLRSAASACRPARWGRCSAENAMHQGRPWERHTVRTTCPYGGVAVRSIHTSRAGTSSRAPAPRPSPTKAGCASRAASAWVSCSIRTA